MSEREARGDAQRLFDALDKYGQHLSHYPCVNPMAPVTACSCGFRDAFVARETQVRA